MSTTPEVFRADLLAFDEALYSDRHGVTRLPGGLYILKLPEDAQPGDALEFRAAIRVFGRLSRGWDTLAAPDDGIFWGHIEASETIHVWIVTRKGLLIWRAAIRLIRQDDIREGKAYIELVKEHFKRARHELSAAHALIVAEDCAAQHLDPDEPLYPNAGSADDPTAWAYGSGLQRHTCPACNGLFYDGQI